MVMENDGTKERIEMKANAASDVEKKEKPRKLDSVESV